MSENLNLYFYKAEVKKIIDGDTLDIVIDLGFDTLRKTRVRLYGINTPESRTSNPEEKLLGLAAKEFVEQWISRNNSKVKIQTILDKNEKYGRILALVWNDDNKCLNEEMILNGYAREYFGVGDKTWLEFKKDS